MRYALESCLEFETLTWSRWHAPKTRNPTLVASALPVITFWAVRNKRLAPVGGGCLVTDAILTAAHVSDALQVLRRTAPSALFRNAISG